MFPDARISVDHISASVPFHTLRGVFKDNALCLQLIAYSVGFGKILRLSRSLTLFNERFDFAVKVVTQEDIDAYRMGQEKEALDYEASLEAPPVSSL